MKKIMSTIIASAMTVSVTATVSVSALNLKEEKLLSVSTEIVASAMTIDGTEVPTGAIAITIDINNNDGFNHSATKLDIGSSNVIVDSTGRPVISKGSMLNDAIISSAKKNNTLVVSSASATTINTDGEMFTFYVSGNYSNTIVTDISDETINTNVEKAISPRSTRYTYYIGDVHHDGSINSSDASTILAAIATYAETSTGDLTVNIANDNITTYFPNIHYAEAADTSKDGKIRRVDANNVLDFYTYIMTGYEWDDAYNELSTEYDNYCGELVVVIEP